MKISQLRYGVVKISQEEKELRNFRNAENELRNFRNAEKELRNFRKWWKVVAKFPSVLRKFRKCLAKFFSVRFLLWFSSLHTWLIWQRLWSSPKLGFFMSFSFNLTLAWIILSSPLFLACFNDKKTIKNIKTCQKLISTLARVLNVPIELKGNKYYSKVFKRVYKKL